MGELTTRTASFDIQWIIFLVTFFCTVATTILVRRTVTKLNILEYPNHRTIHTAATPKLGGIAIYFSLLVGIIMTMLSNILAPDLTKQLLSLITGSCLVFVLGVVDDLKGTNCYQKLLIQAIAATVLFWGGFSIKALIGPFGLQLSLGVFSFPMTVLWFATVSNAINLIDGLDGLAAGVSLIASLIFFVSALWFGNVAIAALTLLLSIALIGFLIFNYHPASIFMGDCGSLVIGFLLAAISITAPLDFKGNLYVVLTILVLAVPISDTIMAIIRRVIKGKHPFKADKEHVHHQLLASGISHVRAVNILYFISAFLGISGFTIILLPEYFQIIPLLATLSLLIWGMFKIGFHRYFRTKRKRVCSFAQKETPESKSFVMMEN